jgi:2,4-dienoyl-CoA reductase (EC 1.3.1.34)
VSLKLGTRATAEALVAGKYDDVVLATGVVPRSPGIPGQEHPKVLSYVDVLLGRRPVGERVAIVGAGGIGFDVATFLVEDGEPRGLDLERWKAEWGVADPAAARGGLVKPRPAKAARRVTLLQRKATRPGAGLAKTTGWIHRAALKAKGVEMLAGARYDRIDDAGLTVTLGKERPETRLLEVDTVVLCAGQEPLRDLEAPLRAAGVSLHLIGGADVAAELDAKRAIEQGTLLAGRL